MSTCYSDRRVFGGSTAGTSREFQSAWRPERGCLRQRRMLLARVGDEVRSWFGDQDAIWRRRVEDSTVMQVNGRRLDLTAHDLRMYRDDVLVRSPSHPNR
jgi:hypothetical protein